MTRHTRVFPCLLLSTLLSLSASMPARGQKPPAVAKASPEWQKVDQLVADQRLQEASQRVQKLLAAARDAGDEAGWTRALIKEVQLRIALGEFENSVRYLKAEKWPAGELHRVALDLFYASLLTQYASAYSWEIGQREKVESKAAVDLKAWTRDQIYTAAQGAYLDIWKRREDLGGTQEAALADYLTQNNYPPGVRGTLRDVVTYLYGELLGNTSFWRPEQQNEIYQLDLPTLLSDKGPKGVKLEDPATHPLAKIASVLADLEVWHKGQGNLEGALMARLERLRFLHASYSNAGDRGQIRADLEKRLPGFTDPPLWSLGMAQLASFVLEEGKPGSRVRAHEIAGQGQKKYPDSVGGQRCLHLVKYIEAPDYQMMSMTSDGIGKRSVQVTHQNLPRLFFRAYPVDVISHIQGSKDYNLLPDWQELRKLARSASAPVSWSVDLPATPDYQSHRTYVTPPIQTPGFYVVVSSARKDFAEKGNRILSVNLLVSDLVLVSHGVADGGFDVIALSGSSGQPAAGAEVSLYRFDWGKGHRQVDRKVADDKGTLRFSYRDDKNSGSYFLIGKKGADLALQTDGVGMYRQTDTSSKASLIYTDRSVYRPLQKLYFKTLAYQGSARDARYRSLPNTPISVSLFDPNGQRVETKEFSTNSFGTASGEFVIPAGRVLGVWRVASSMSGTRYVRVEEYKRPTFESSFKDPEAPLRLNRPATMIGEARYYFGLPVSSGAVKWRVTREPVYPYYWGWYGYATPGGGTQTVAAGSATVAKDGTFRFTFTPKAEEGAEQKEDQKEISYRYAVSADVTDEGGETRSATRSFRLGLVSVEAWVVSDAAFFLSGQKGGAGGAATMTIVRTDLSGTPRPGKGSWRLLGLKQPDKTLLLADLPVVRKAEPGAVRTPGDDLRPRWGGDGDSLEARLHGWAEGGEKGRGALVHGQKGEAQVALGELAPGAYRLRYETVDDFGAPFTLNKDFVVAGKERTGLAVPSLLLAERSSVPVGGTARFLALSGLADQRLFFDVYRAGKLVDRRLLDSSKDRTLIEMPVTEADRGGFSVALSGVRDHQLLSGEGSIFVPWDDKELKLEFSTFRDRIRPGAKETFRVTVKGQKGPIEAGTAELLAYMYDRSLDLFAPHDPANPLTLYPNRTGAAWTRVSLGQASGQWLSDQDFRDIPGDVNLHGDQLAFLDGYGIGGMGVRGGFGGGRGPMMMRSARMEMAPMESTAAPAPAAPAQVQAPAGKAVAVATKNEPDRDGDGIPDSKDKEAAAPPLRQNFSETAFWLPNLLTLPDGSAAIEFTVPDSVTSWNVWVHAVTRDLRAGSVVKETRSIKDLLVRPYLPRFLREGDRADIKVVVNNASTKEMKGQVSFEILDPDTGKSLAADFGLQKGALSQPFTVAASGGTDLSFSLTAPRRVGPVSFKVIARAGDLSDGELRPLPVLPGRVHLMQSRFVTLKNRDRKTLTFADLAKSDDPTRVNDQLVVTVDAQLFYSVLSALPYLINYPYECTEQTLNRFVSTGIVSSLYKDYPAVAKMAQTFSKRTTPLESFDAADPNRAAEKMTLEETPWLQEAKGGQDAGSGMVNVLDPRTAQAQRDASMLRLRKAQTAIGGFPWWPGGPPSPYMTLYILHGFARANEFGVDVPKDMVQRGFAYLAQHFRQEYRKRMLKEDCCWEFLTFYNYVVSSFPDALFTGGALSDAERKEILEHSFKHWRQHSPYLKGYLTLTLLRAGRKADAQKVFASVMDSSKTTADQGTFWAPEDRSWLWYNDTIESHAFALRTLMELSPDDGRKDGLVQWLLINKKMNQWKSTRATAEVIYSLVRYLKQTGALGVREDATVEVGPQKVSFTFEPDQYTGKKNQVVVPGDKVDGKTMSQVVVHKESQGMVFASATWHFSTEKLPTQERGDFFSVSRSYFKREQGGPGAGGFVLKPIGEAATLQPGDEVEVHLSLRSKAPAEYVHLRDPRAAGLEPENAVSRFKWDLGIGWYEETRDSGANFFFENLPQGEYTFKYRLRVNMKGSFRVGPATVQSMYAPEFGAYSTGTVLNIK